MRPALFLHIQKTAGSSIQRAAEEFYGRDDCCMWGDYIVRTPQELNNLSFLSGHFGYDFAQQFMAGRYCFTFLRDPIERLLSLYSYCRNANKAEYAINALAHEGDIEQFLRAGSTADEPFASHMWNHQACQLANGWGASLLGKRDVGPGELRPDEILARATENLRTFNYVGLVEHFETDCAAIFEALGDGSKATYRVNVAPDRIKREDLNEATLSVLEQMTQIDGELYRRAVALRAEAHQKLQVEDFKAQ
jgi:hypothetical protein